MVIYGHWSDDEISQPTTCIKHFEDQFSITIVETLHLAKQIRWPPC